LKHAKTYRDIAQVQPEVINNIPDLALPAGMNYSQEDFLNCNEPINIINALTSLILTSKS
jgi:hypothetical protein